MPTRIDFYFFVGSTYSYLSVNRAAAVAAAHGVSLVWRPFSVRTLMREQNNSPFSDKPVKLRYMWRDVERRAALYELPFAGPPQYPIDSHQLANHVATLAAMEGWCEEFAKAAYRKWFIEKLDPGVPENLASVLLSLGKSADYIDRAASPEVLDKYTAETDRARDLGVFGSPTFVVDDEVFWGDDRLEDAISWSVAARSVMR